MTAVIFKRKKRGDTKTAEQYEKCVLCGKVTDVKKDTHIDLRTNYVEGCGQLCAECYGGVYEKSGSEL